MTDLTFKEFSRVNRLRCESPNGFNHPLNEWTTSDWMVATLGELGEAANVLKKLNRVRDGNSEQNNESPDELKLMFVMELADAYIYLDLLAQSCGIDLEEAITTAFNTKSLSMNCPIEVIKK